MAGRLSSFVPGALATARLHRRERPQSAHRIGLRACCHRHRQ